MRPRLGVTQHRALWSPDFPRSVQSTDRDRLADLGVDSMIAYGLALSRFRPGRSLRGQQRRIHDLRHPFEVEREVKL